MTTAVQEQLRAGKLTEAIALMNTEVRNNPTDIERRAQLAELLCVAGNLERADAILDAIGTLDPGTAPGVALFRQLVRAAQARHQFLGEGRMPEFLKRPDGAVELELRATVALRDGAISEAAALLAQAEEMRPRAAGHADGAAFDDFRDLDDLSAAHLEVLTSTGKYYWIPIKDVGVVEFRRPERRRDLLWRRAFVSVVDGPEGEVFIPAIYASLKNDIEAQFRLGYASDFVEEQGLTRGIGLRCFMIDDESPSILEVNRLEFLAAKRTGTGPPAP